jgi:hypothetical protein
VSIGYARIAATSVELLLPKQKQLETSTIITIGNRWAAAVGNLCTKTRQYTGSENEG